jgi:outer membrane receptor for ferrienterochelin and colicin
VKRKRLAFIGSLLAALLVLVFTIPANAESTGKINGTVYDPDGVPLGGVEVVIKSPDMMGVRKTQTAEDGGFLFFGLPPGRYSVEIVQEGFLPFKQEGLRVKLGGTATLDILMEVPTAEETVVVTAKRPVVDKESTVLGVSFDDEYLEGVPITRDYQSVASLAPGVVGGGNPNVHGGSMYNNQYLIDGINITDPATNTFSANMNYDAIKEFQILTGGLDAEYGQAMGGIINVVTKSGSNEFHLDTSLYMAPDMFVYRESWEEEAAGEQNSYTFNINVGGPIIKDRLWYFASIEYNKYISTIPATEDWFDPTNPDLLVHPSRDWDSIYYLAKLTFQASDRHKLVFMTMGDPTFIDNALQDSTVSKEAEAYVYQGGSFYSLSWEALWSKNLFQKTQIGFGGSTMEQKPMVGCTDVNDESCRGHQDRATGLSTGNYTRNSLDHRYRLQVDSAWTYYLDDLFGDHEFKAGWNYTYAWDDFKNNYPGGAVYLDDNGQPDQLRQWVLPEGETAWTSDDQSNTLGIFLQDSWKITENLIIKPGVRFDWVQLIDDVDRTVMEYKTTSPRLNLVWDITGDGKTVFRAGYNRYAGTPWFNVSGFLGKRVVMDTYDYNPITGEYDLLYERTGEVQDVIKGENETAPHTDEISFQVERELFTDFSVALHGIWREAKYLFEDDEVNEIYNQEGTDVIGYKSDDETYIYRTQNPREAWRRYWGLEIVAKKDFSDNWQLNASYTYSRSEGSTDDYWTAYLDNPRQNQYWWSFTSFDRRHVIKLDGVYHFPYGIEIGYNMFWATGYPYSKYFKDDRYGAYYLLKAPRGYDPDHPDNEHWNRLPDVLSMNLKIVWDTKEVTGHKIDIIGQFHNVLNLRYKTDLETSAYPAGSAREYGHFYGMTGGFYAEIGLRYRY